MNKLWLPEGHRPAHDLHIEHDTRRPGSGPMEGGGWKLLWHTTEGRDLRTMQRVLYEKNAGPHFLLGRDGTDRKHFTVVQFFPLNQGARALRNDASDLLPTNRANCIQVEICGYAKDAPQDYLQPGIITAMAQLTRLIENRVKIPRKAPRSFKVGTPRYTDRGFVNAEGHVGHAHAPDNDHWDPGHLNIGKVFRTIERIES
jgi:hypothetical protein